MQSLEGSGAGRSVGTQTGSMTGECGAGPAAVRLLSRGVSCPRLAPRLSLVSFQLHVLPTLCPRRACLVPPSLSAPFHPASPVSPSSSAPGLPRVLLQLGTLLALCLLHALLALCLPPSPRPACFVSPAEHPVSQQLPPGRLRPSLLARRVSWVCAPQALLHSWLRDLDTVSRG